MTDFIINNPITLRGCILYEFTKGNTPFETYKELMKTLGDEFMEYPKFEFWYMRFAQGNFDLDYDFSLETKKRQITDFPVEVFEKVGDSLHFEDRIQLRLVSKDIQFRVDNWDPKVRKFSYNSCNGWEIVQNSETYGFYKATGLLAYFTGRQRNPLAAVVRILKYPKLRLKKLFVTQDAKWMKTEEELRQSSTKLHVNLVVVEYPDYPIDIGLFAPESLERVTVYTNEKSAKKINEIVKPEQCKHLRMFTIEASNSLCEFPNNSFFGYPRFTIECFDDYDAEKVAEFIKKLVKSTQLELCNLLTYSDDPDTWEPIKEYFSEKDTLVPDSPNLRRYPIQGSTDFYEINIERTSISIERKS